MEQKVVFLFLCTHAIRPTDLHICKPWCVSYFLFWTIGPPHDLQVREVRSDSLVLLWKPPVYQGRDLVNGFYIDIKEADEPVEAWKGVNTKATEKTFFKVPIVRLSYFLQLLVWQQLWCNLISFFHFAD